MYLSDSSRRLRGQALVPKPAVSAVPVAVGASLCMGAPKPGQTPVEVMPCAQVLPQRWNVQAEGGAQIIADAANYCLDLLGGNTQNGSPVEIWDCNGSPQQHWGYDADPAQKTIYLSDSSRRLRGQALVPKPAVSAVPVAVGASLCMGAP